MQNKESRIRIVGGLFIIVMGVLSLIHNLLTPDVASWMWIAGLTLSAVIFLWAFTYEHEVWAAVGTYVTAAIALLICLVTQFAMAEQMTPYVVLIGIALPFFATWWFYPQQWGALIPAYIMVAIMPVLVLEDMDYIQSEIIPAYVLFAVALPFLIGYFVTHKTMLLVPGGVLLVISAAFFGVGLGLSSQILTTLLPIAIILAGVYLILRANSSEKLKQH